MLQLKDEAKLRHFLIL